MSWGVVVPVKALPHAKSRLLGHSQAQRGRLALAFARDTVAAALLTPEVGDVVVVTDDQEVAAAMTGAGVVVLGEAAAGGLNAALEHGAAWLRGQQPARDVVALCADLPALRPRDLSAALDQAAQHSRVFVLDAAGTGTTLLAATTGTALQPCFGAGSGAAHRATGAHAVAGVLASLRRDVDDGADLASARLLGLGPWTTAALVRD